MSKCLIERVICNKCHATEEYIVTPERMSSKSINDPSAAYGFWTYESGLGHLCEKCSKELRTIKEEFFKKGKGDIDVK